MPDRAGSPIRTVAAVLLGLSTAVVACGETNDAYGMPGGFSATGGSSAGGAAEGGAGGGAQGGAAQGGAAQGGAAQGGAGGAGGK